ncbi:MAG: hypothetical protein E7360_00700 [Clostridiales bacterium]|nr:hypothetical protein [Clostridiales bacterium]
MEQIAVNEKLKSNEPIILPTVPLLSPQKIDEPKKEEPQKVEEKKLSEAEKTAHIFGQSEEEICKEFRAFKATKIFKKFDFDLTEVFDEENLKSKVDEAVKIGFGNVVVNPKFIKTVRQRLKGKKIGVYAAVCYPFGEELYGVKKYATKLAFSNGADGIYLPVGVADILRGRIEGIKREFAKIIKRNRKKKVFAVLEIGELDRPSCEKVLKSLSKLKLSGIVCGTGKISEGKNLTATDVHALSGGKTTVVAYGNSQKSREIINLFSVADRVFLKNATKIATDLKNNLEC